MAWAGAERAALQDEVCDATIERFKPVSLVALE